MILKQISRTYFTQYVGHRPILIRKYIRLTISDNLVAQPDYQYYRGVDPDSTDLRAEKIALKLRHIFGFL